MAKIGVINSRRNEDKSVSGRVKYSEGWAVKSFN